MSDTDTVLLMPEMRAAALAALWAQQLGLPLGNSWEAPITRHIIEQWHRLGADTGAWALTEVLFRMRVGLPSARVS